VINWITRISCGKPEGAMKVTALIFALLTLATVSGAAMVASLYKQPVLLACGGPNC
jgi:hypothetical protein